ncbi:hypothetical protein GUJ93_ZPchr0013g35165 [Zizania palustris]|uniref:Uncharacterized protein n=1 Tax=Zizania palustris TaxID=103762 RepID=A0A8J6C219_ZIZPA|nr:hypothetical protein GUJ93_ZPchr0013g35165 [Zizania palustris]KAG8097363.1 hypothetical protein GUJ93_ZPchr0013g35165 [Zizania palustris]
MEADGEKGAMTVVGEVDVVCVVTELRKAKFTAVVVSVGPEKEPDPPKKPDPDEPKKPDEPKPPLHHCCDGACNFCRPCPPPPCGLPAGGGVVVYEEAAEDYGCIIM